MNNYIKVLPIIFSIVLCQNNIEIKQYNIFKNKYDSHIDLKEYIDDYNGNYVLKLISIDQEKYERKKKVIIELCDLEFSIFSNLSNINIKRCDNKLTIDGEIILDDNNSILTFDNSKYKYLESNLIFWIYGSFKSNFNNTIVEDGLLQEFYDNGNKKIEYNYYNGTKNGEQKKWYDNNQLSMKYHYTNGKLDGLQKKWYRNGNLKSEISYYNDILDGIYKYWYSNGQLKFVKSYKNGELVDIIENYDINGNPQ